MCVWCTVLVCVVGEDDCILEKEGWTDGEWGRGCVDSQSISALSLVPALRLS